jgi:hypothetical protein
MIFRLVDFFYYIQEYKDVDYRYRNRFVIRIKVFLKFVDFINYLLR